MTKEFVCFYCDGWDDLGWRGTRVKSVQAETKEEAAALVSAEKGREVIRVVQVSG